MHVRLVLASLLLSGCFGEEVHEADTDSALVADCRACQAHSENCADYEAACRDDAECDVCVEAPFGLTCLANTNMHALGSCSCERCESECDYLCPGSTGACNVCGMQNCQAEASACIADAECAPCLEDTYREGCADNPLFMMAQACLCPACGQACIWQCPMAGNTCAACLSGQCTDPFSQCMQDETCNECFSSPFLSTCADNMPHQTLMVCVCGACSQDCGVLFDCGQ